MKRKWGLCNSGQVVPGFSLPLQFSRLCLGFQGTHQPAWPLEAGLWWRFVGLGVFWGSGTAASPLLESVHSFCLFSVKRDIPSFFLHLHLHLSSLACPSSHWAPLDHSSGAVEQHKLQWLPLMEIVPG
jgi:hypothetical protein